MSPFQSEEIRVGRLILLGILFVIVATIGLIVDWRRRLRDRQREKGWK
jgi:hypothetical protein